MGGIDAGWVSSFSSMSRFLPSSVLVTFPPLMSRPSSHNLKYSWLVEAELPAHFLSTFRIRLRRVRHLVLVVDERHAAIEPRHEEGLGLQRRAPRPHSSAPWRNRDVGQHVLAVQFDAVAFIDMDDVDGAARGRRFSAMSLALRSGSMPRSRTILMPWLFHQRRLDELDGAFVQSRPSWRPQACPQGRRATGQAERGAAGSKAKAREDRAARKRAQKRE